MLIFLLACNSNLLTTSGELGRLNYWLNADYNMDGMNLSDYQMITGYPQDINIDLTLKGWKMVDDEPYLVYHEGEAGLDVDSETVLDGSFGVPGVTVQADETGSYQLTSKIREEEVDRIQLSFAKPDELEILSWMRTPGAETFEKSQSDVISTTLGTQATFIPIPSKDGQRLIGRVEVELSVEPETAAVVGANIESVTEDSLDFSTNPASVYFVETGTVRIGITDTYNDVTTWQEFSVN